VRSRLRPLALVLTAWPIFLAIGLTQGHGEEPSESAPSEQTPRRPDAYPGQSSHAHPPTDYFCEHRSETSLPARECDCHRVATDLACEGEPVAPVCRSYCFEKAHQVPDGQGGMKWEGSHCHCEIFCGPPVQDR